jgi:NAD(P)-dependent dehydrogenase (short-subunit alcohol dehydrogenase family)
MQVTTSYNPFSLEGKTILITGASSGIGRSAAVECSKMGARLIITARNEERLAETFDALTGSGHQRLMADLTIQENIENMTAFLSPLDGVVNAAGIDKVKPVQFITENDLDSLLRTNTYAPVFLTQRLYKAKKINKNASIVFVSSIGGVFSITPGGALYGMSKSAVNTFMKYAALEMASKGIRCNSINPGMVETPLINNDAYSSEDKERNIAKYPLKRYGMPCEIAFGIIYLLSDASTWVTGTSLVIDGGFSLT